MLQTLRRFRRARAVVATIALMTTEACYAYRPVVTPTPTVGGRVRVVLTREGTTELARYLGPNVAVAEGDLSSIATDGAYSVAVDFVQMMNGIRQQWTGEGLVSIPSIFRSEVHERVFLRRQTTIAAAAITAGLVAIAAIALAAGGAGGGTNGGGGQPPP